MNLDFSTYAQWSGLVTVACLLLAVAGFIWKWGIRFRLVGITGFMAVLTVGLLALGLGLFARTEVPGAVRYSLAYDNGANQAAIVVSPSITESELEATLRQAAADLFSYGRSSIGGDSKLTIRARALIHPEPGVSQPLYLGQVRRSLTVRDDQSQEVKIFSEQLAKLDREGHAQAR